MSTVRRVYVDIIRSSSERTGTRGKELSRSEGIGEDPGSDPL